MFERWIKFSLENNNLVASIGFCGKLTHLSKFDPCLALLVYRYLHNKRFYNFHLAISIIDIWNITLDIDQVSTPLVVYSDKGSCPKNMVNNGRRLGFLPNKVELSKIENK